MSDEELIAMARLAQRDDRMATGALYGDLADRIEALVKENTALKEHVADMLAEQECGCGYDNPTDVCLGHLPLHRKTVARAEQLAATNEQLEAALRELIDHTHNCEKELTEDLHRADFCGESLPLTNARATLAEMGDATDD